MKYIKEYLETVVKIKPLGELTTKEDELNGLSGEMAYIDGKCSDIFISHADYANWLESKYEQKPVHKVGPKFKVGDWVASDYNNVAYIESISETKYNLRCKDGYHEKISIEYIDRCWHLWSIKDAKPGDVLVAAGDVIAPEIPEFNSSTFIAIYKEQNGEYFNSHCYVGLDGKFYKGQNGHVNENVHPATKEQRDLLFQKMYEWNAEKKVLKKIEPLTDFEKAFQGMCCEKNKQFVKECCKTLIELARKQLQPERNELELDETSYKVGVSRVLENPESYGLTKNYLKPSSSDIEALEDIMNGNSNPTSYLVLQSIIEQLKTLK